MIEKQYKKISELKKELPGKIATRAEDSEKLKETERFGAEVEKDY